MSIVLGDEDLKEFEDDSEWLNSNYNKLIQEYDKEYVAIKNQTVIKHDKDLDKLKEKLNQDEIKLGTIFIEFIRDKKNQLH